MTFGIALGGIATVGFVWWLARAAGAGIAGAAVAGLLTAISAQMIDASVRLWNPAFVAPAAAFALAAAFEGRRRNDPRWWIPVGIGLVLAGQSHVLAWVLVAPSPSWPSTSSGAPAVAPSGGSQRPQQSSSCRSSRSS